MIPRLTLRLGGVLQNTAPEPRASTQPRLVIRLNGIVKSIVSIPSSQPLENLNKSSGDSDWGTHNEDEDEGDLLEEVDRYFDKMGGEDSEYDQDDGPDWMFEDDEVPATDPDYVFCPAPHRRQILHLFTKHFCQHPLFAEKDGKWSADQIRRNAVHEMYNFCFVRGLREVWGYLWACWYSSKMWPLWARSTSPYISRLRTTMNVENFWR